MLPVGIIALGLVQGALAGLNSVGLVLVWRTTRVVNLAQSSLGLVGGVLVGLLVASAGWSFWWSVPVGLAFGALLGLASDRLLVRLSEAPRVVLLVATVGLAQIFAAIYTMLPFLFDGPLPAYTIELGVTLDLFPVRLLGPHLLALLALPLAVAFVMWWLARTRVGLAACALGQDAERARALGVPAGAVRSAAWALAGVLSTLSGILSIPVLGFSLGEGVAPAVLLLALAPAVLAGLRSVPKAAAAALGLGIAYQACLWYAPTAGVAEILLAVAVVAAIAQQRRRLGRMEAATRASSFQAATTPRPLPWAVTRSLRFRVAAAIAVGVALVAAVVPPLLLSPSQDVLYATSAALALGAVAVAAAWMFAGEVSLGHWGLAGVGAAVAAVAPGPWPARAAIATVAVGAIGALLGKAARRSTGLSFAVLGLAVAVAAPVLVLRLGQATVPADPNVVGPVAGAAAILAAVAVARLRASRLGARLVAARDEPQRAPWLGADPARGRVIALGLSGGMAGLAGALYLAATPAGIAPGAFDAGRSLWLLAMAVVGGLGSAAGAILGAAVLQLAAITLPGPWALLASGVGVLVAVVYAPAGLSGISAAVRDRAVRLLLGPDAVTRPSTLTLEPEVVPPVSAAPPADAATAWLAGSDTREALGTPTVRRATTAAFFTAAVGWAAMFGTPAAWAAWAPLPGALRPWIVLVLAGALAGAAALGWRAMPATADAPDWRKAVSTTAVLAAAPAALGLLAFVTGDAILASFGIWLIPPVSGWVLGRVARVATLAALPWFASAAAGLVALSALAGLIGTAHLGMVAGGSGLPRAGLWTAAYATLAAVAVLRMGRDVARDRRRLAARVLPAVAGPGGDHPPLAMQLDRVRVCFGSTAVLGDASLTVAPGEMLALVGGNGAGKSTLLRVAAGLHPCDAGRVILAGEDLGLLRPEERAAAGLAFVSGARPVFPDLTVLENLRVAAYRTHRTSRAFTAATDAVLQVVPTLAARRDSKVGLLSGGEQRLLAVAQTLYRTPTVLLADELSLGLDAQARVAVLDLLRVLADDGVAVVVVDHDLVTLLPRADRAALLTEGAIREYKRPTYLLSRRSDLLPATFLAGATSHAETTVGASA